MSDGIIIVLLNDYMLTHGSTYKFNRINDQLKDKSIFRLQPFKNFIHMLYTPCKIEINEINICIMTKHEFILFRDIENENKYCNHLPEEIIEISDSFCFINTLSGIIKTFNLKILRSAHNILIHRAHFREYELSINDVIKMNINEHPLFTKTLIICLSIPENNIRLYNPMCEYSINEIARRIESYNFKETYDEPLNVLVKNKVDEYISKELTISELINKREDLIEELKQFMET